MNEGKAFTFGPIDSKKLLGSLDSDQTPIDHVRSVLRDLA